VTTAGAAAALAAFHAPALHRVLGLRDLSPSAFVLRLSRGSLDFQPGQWINVGIAGTRERREYSVYSPPSVDFLEILVKEILEGAVSPRLRRARPGDLVQVEGPAGGFTMEGPHGSAGRFILIATGTGISPMHCLTQSHPGLDYTLVHGVRSVGELYEHGHYDPDRVIPCVSREPVPGCPRRVTSWLTDHFPGREAFYYVCGNSDMIYDVFEILRSRRVPRSRVFAEIYF
jgi:ferredoxin/flavodoxin---NADP+ reductase